MKFKTICYNSRGLDGILVPGCQGKEFEVDVINNKSYEVYYISSLLYSPTKQEFSRNFYTEEQMRDIKLNKILNEVN